jgi:hypothetical protein
MKIIYEWEVKDRVKLPFDETGTIVEIKDLPWGFKYRVRIRKGSIFNNTNQIVEFKYEQLQPDV